MDRLYQDCVKNETLRGICRNYSYPAESIRLFFIHAFRDDEIKEDSDDSRKSNAA